MPDKTIGFEDVEIKEDTNGNIVFKHLSTGNESTLYPDGRLEVTGSILLGSNGASINVNANGEVEVTDEAGTTTVIS